jgi:hypothetical protein
VTPQRAKRNFPSRPSRRTAPAASSKPGTTHEQDEAKLYGSDEIVKLANITYRQLQWWDEQGWICPRHVGHRREYTHDQLKVAAALSKLRAAKIGHRKGLLIARKNADTIDEVISSIAKLKKLGLKVS